MFCSLFFLFLFFLFFTFFFLVVDFYFHSFVVKKDAWYNFNFLKLTEVSFFVFSPTCGLYWIIYAPERKVYSATLESNAL